MVVTNPSGTLADVRAARRVLYAKFEPSLLLYAAWAAGFAFCCGSKLLSVTLVGAAALPVASLTAMWWQSWRSRSISPRRIRLFSRRVFVLTSVLSVLGVIAVLATVGLLVVALLHRWASVPVISHRGTPMAYLVPFGVFLVPVLAVATLSWRLDPYGIDARLMRKAPDHPVTLDPLLEPRQQIIVCAMLAGVDWIEAGFFAKTLRLTDQEFRRQTAELVAAQYINVHPHDGQWWFGFTAVGRAAYRRHLRALERASAAKATVAAGEPVVVDVDTAPNTRQQWLLRALPGADRRGLPVTGAC
jgi:hypothetical protein